MAETLMVEAFMVVEVAMEVQSEEKERHGTDEVWVRIVAGIGVIRGAAGVAVAIPRGRRAARRRRR